MALAPESAVEVAPDAPVDEAPPDVSVDDEPDVSVDDDPEFEVSVEVAFVEEPELPLLFTGSIDRVQVLTSRTAGLPWSSVIGVSCTTHFCVMSPAGLYESERWVAANNTACARRSCRLGHDGCGLSI